DHHARVVVARRRAGRDLTLLELAAGRRSGPDRERTGRGRALRRRARELQPHARLAPLARAQPGAGDELVSRLGPQLARAMQGPLAGAEIAGDAGRARPAALRALEERRGRALEIGPGIAIGFERVLVGQQV